MTTNARGSCQKEGLLVSTRASSTNVSKPENQKNKNKKTKNKSETYVRYYHLQVLRFVFVEVFWVS